MLMKKTGRYRVSFAERRAVKDFVLKDPLLSEYLDMFLFEDAPAKSKSAEKA